MSRKSFRDHLKENDITVPDGAVLPEEDGPVLSLKEDDEKIRHPENKKAYVQKIKNGYKASNKHGNLKLFNELGRKSAFKHADIKEEVEYLDELSPQTIRRYNKRAQADHHAHFIERSKHAHEAQKAFIDGDKEKFKDHMEKASFHLKKMKNRVTGIDRAQRKTTPWVVKEDEQLDEREDLSVSYRAAVHRRDTQKHDVRHRSNQRMRHMTDTNRTQYVMRTGFKPRSGDPHSLVDRQKHQLTDRWRNQRMVRLQLLRKNKNLKEDSVYLKNRQMIHDAHAQAGREIGKRERDPELKRIHMHRSRKHAHASKVLEILRSRKKKK